MTDRLEGTKLANFEPTKKVENLEVIDLQDGTGETVPEGARITAHYTGALCKDGTIFQSSHDFGEPVTFGVGQVIPGWTEALQLMKEGDKWTLYIPDNLAYGERGAGGQIPPYAVLIFEVELIKVN